MTVIPKDITTIESGIIVHQVNCQGVMGSGVAKAIRDKWPQVFSEYKSKFDGVVEYIGESGKYFLLGQIQKIKINDNLYIINLFGQLNYGFKQERYTSYEAWEKGLLKIKEEALKLKLPIYFPFLTGCHRGGGDWRIISAMIEEHFRNAIFCSI